MYSRFLAGVALLVIALDQATKAWAVANLEHQPEIHVIGNVVRLGFVRNPGAAFSFGTGNTWIFTIFAVAATVFVALNAKRIAHKGWALAAAGIVGGALGNLTDRILREPGSFQGHVVDFIRLPHYPLFNLADCAIVLSAGLIVVMSLRGIEWKDAA